MDTREKIAELCKAWPILPPPEIEFLESVEDKAEDAIGTSISTWTAYATSVGGLPGNRVNLFVDTSNKVCRLTHRDPNQHSFQPEAIVGIEGHRQASRHELCRIGAPGRGRASANRERRKMSQQVQLTLGNLYQLNNGVIDEAFKREMARVIADCQDRPALDKERTVSIVFAVKPWPDTHAPTINADEVVVQAQVHSSIPKRKSSVYTMRTKHDNTVTFHPEAPEEPEADRLYDDDVRDRERGKGRNSSEE